MGLDLYKYQRDGVNALVQKNSLLLADEMGLGKTIQVIVALRRLFEQGDISNALVVAPAGVVLNWRRELKRWAPKLRLSTVLGTAAQRTAYWNAPAQVFLTSYDSLRSDLSRVKRVRDLWDVVVVDEAQRIKNPGSGVSVAVKSLKRRRSWALTGTPLENSTDDLISILDFVAPGRFRANEYLSGLRRLLSEVQLRRRRKEVLRDLPPKISVETTLTLSGSQAAEYRKAELKGIADLTRLGDEMRIEHVLSLIVRLKQICNFCPVSGESAKLSDLRSRLIRVREGGERALVFSQYVREPFGLKRLAGELKEFGPLVLSGELSLSVREEAIARFKKDAGCSVLLASLKAGGVGLNLTEASYVFHFDRWWNPASESQAEDRAHRIGQERPVHVYSYVCQSTIEERIAVVLARKRRLFTEVVEGISVQHLEKLGLDELWAALRGEGDGFGRGGSGPAEARAASRSVTRS